MLGKNTERLFGDWMVKKIIGEYLSTFKCDSKGLQLDQIVMSDFPSKSYKIATIHLSTLL